MVEKEKKDAVRGQWPPLGLNDGYTKDEKNEEDSQDGCGRFKESMGDRNIVRY